MIARKLASIVVVAVGCLLCACGGSALAAGEGPGWELMANTYPTYIAPGGVGNIAIKVFNIGAGASHGRITVTDTLPVGLTAIDAGNPRNFHDGGGTPLIERRWWYCTGNGPGGGVNGASQVTCANEGPAGFEGISEFLGGGGVPWGSAGLDPDHPWPQPQVGIQVRAGAAASGLTNRATIAGGGAPSPATVEEPITISSGTPPFSFTGWKAWLSNADGTIDTQAGSHPYEATFAFALPTEPAGSTGDLHLAGGAIRNIEVQLPPGFVGNPTAVPECTREQLEAGISFGHGCPKESEVGIDTSYFAQFAEVGFPVFNMVPPAGVAAEFGFSFEGSVVFIDASVRSGSDYGLTANSDGTPEKEIMENTLVLWNVPGERSHDLWRSGEPFGCPLAAIERSKYVSGLENLCAEPQNPLKKPLFTVPTSCGGPAVFGIRANTWRDEGDFAGASSVTELPNGVATGFTGCGADAFAPLFSVAPDTAKADTPAGLTVEVKPPVGGLENEEGLGTSDIQDTSVTLPAGFVINPGQAAGLQACQQGDVEGGDDLPLPGEDSGETRFNGPARCPAASKVGTVVIESPLIEGASEKRFEGSVYVMQSNPPEVKLLVAASADGVNLKLIGVVHLNEATGQLTATFVGTPALPFTAFKLSFSGGPQAALDTPTHCGSFEAVADFTPWGSPSIADFPTNAGFTLSEGPDGTACPAGVLPFAPELTAGSTTDQAGGSTGFSMLLSRGDGQQRVERLQFKIPAGLSGIISSVPQCGEPQAAQGTCPASSRVGHTVVTSGPGPYPLVIPQPGEPEAAIYLTGPYKGAPFGLSIVTPVIAGPFNLGTIVTRATIEVDPHTAQITVTTDPLPQLVDGVPTDLRSVYAVINRPGFMINPTNCAPSSFSGTAWGTPPPGVSEPAETDAISSHFQVGSCRSLGFKPTFTTATKARASKANGASLSFKISYPKGAMGNDAWFNEAQFDIPKQLPARLSTLQQSCLAATFETNRAACPKASVIGHAVVHTPLLPVPLEGSVYFVSYGAARFPDAVLDLHGDNVHIELHGETFISKTSVTSATFRNTPDVPFESIEVNVPMGPYSEFGANLPPKDNYDFCGQKLKMPTFFKAQNGLEIHQNTPVTITGCPKAKKAKKAKNARKAAKKHMNTASHKKTK